MIKKLEITDIEVINRISGISLQERNDVNWDMSGISYDVHGNVRSFVVMGKRTLTEYFNGSMPKGDPFLDDTEGSQEIIAYYSVDGSETFYEVFMPFVWIKLRNWSQTWYIPKDELDAKNAIKCINMVWTKHNVLVKRMA